MTSVEALKLAVSKEDGAIRLYKKLAVEHPGIKDLLDSLLLEEEKHKKLIEERIFKVTRG